MKIIIFQEYVPEYRIDFFNQLNDDYDDFVVYVPENRISNKVKKYQWLSTIGNNYNFLSLFSYTKNISHIPISRESIVVILGNPRSLASLYLLFKCIFFGAKSVWWGHYHTAGSNFFLKRIRLAFASIASARLFYVEKETDLYSDFLLSKNNNNYSLNNGLNIHPIKSNSKKYNSSKRQKSILFIGRITKKSNFSLLFNAVNSLNGGIHLHVISDAGETTKSNYFSPYITFHPYTYDEELISKVANSCLFFVYAGSVGLSLIHAMSYGLPVLIHNNFDHQMPEAYATKILDVGLTFEENNLSDLRDKLLKMSKSDLLDHWSENALLVTSSKFNTNCMTKNFEGMINNISRFYE